MRTPEPFIIQNERYYNVRQAAQIIEKICVKTLWNWAKHGTSPKPYDIDLGVIREPIVHHRTHHRHEPQPVQPRAYRMLIREDSVYALKELLRDFERHPGSFRKDEVAEFESRAYRLRRNLKLTCHL